MSYFSFFRSNWAMLSFGMLMTGFSAFGQTYFIALFNGALQQEFSLSAGEIGSWYGIATLTSGFCLIWLGPFVDKARLPIVTSVVVVALAISCMSMALLPQVGLLVIVYFFLRLSGQGFMSHVSLTTLGKRFDANRGKALSLGVAGFSIGEAFLPFLAVFLVSTFGWRETWGAMALFLVLIFLPLVLFLLNASDRTEQHNDPDKSMAEGKASDWTRLKVLRDFRFYLIIPNLIAAPFILTGLFFHAVHMANEKNWEITIIAQGLLLFSFASFVATLIIGSLVDRFGATRLYGFGVWFMIISFIALVAGDENWLGLAFYLLSGLTAGVNGTLSGALWAELYGTRHLGSIRSLTSAIMILSTGAAPALFGWMIDLGYSMNEIAFYSTIYTLAASLLVIITLFRIPRHSSR